MNVPVYISGMGLAADEDFLEKAAAFLPSPPGIDGAKPLAALIPGLNLRRISQIGRLALQASAQALAFGGRALPLNDDAGARTGLFVGTALGAAGHSFAFLDSVLDGGARLASPTQFSQSVTNVLSGALSMFLNTQGPINTICQYGLSFAGAWQCGLSAIQAGEAEQALVGAVEEHSGHVDLLVEHSRKATRFSAPAHTLAVFFLLSARAGGALARVASTRWSFGGTLGEAGLAEPDFYLGNERADDGITRFYAGHPAEQALDVAAALGLMATGRAGEARGRSAVCAYTDPDRPCRSEIVLETL